MCIRDRNAISFLEANKLPQGGYPQVVYDDGSKMVYPTWMAGVSDIIRVLHKNNREIEKLVRWMLNGADPCGAVRTAKGFNLLTGRKSVYPPFLDLLHVVGWNDKVFRLLTELLTKKELPEPDLREHTEKCLCKNSKHVFFEDRRRVELIRETDKKVIYCWVKGENWAMLRQ